MKLMPNTLVLTVAILLPFVSLVAVMFDLFNHPSHEWTLDPTQCDQPTVR
jgi:hypothetical protein